MPIKKHNFVLVVQTIFELAKNWNTFTDVIENQKIRNVDSEVLYLVDNLEHFSF